MKTVRTWKTEFPRMDDSIVDLVASLPGGFDDQSWHNDTCPSFAKKTATGFVRVWIDYADPEERELGGERFSVDVLDENYENSGHVMSSDDWHAVLDVLVQYR